jgi:hypothetical protein
MFLATAFLCIMAQAIHAGDLFVQVLNPGWTNSSQYSWTSAWGDYDKDGYIDLFVANNGRNFLYHNNKDGTFARMTTNEVGPIAKDADLTVGVYWGDVNNDGQLDLIALNDIASATSSPVVSRLYLNQGKGMFASMSGTDLTKPYYTGGWGNMVDYDNDGFLDFFSCAAATETGHRTNLLFHGRGDGTFSLVRDGVMATNQISSSFSNDATWSDFDNDGDMDLIVANIQAKCDFFYRNDGHGQFSRLTNSILEKSGYHTLQHAWGDYDNDGWLDVASTSDTWTRLFRNNGHGDFELITSWSEQNGTPVWADYDNDGYLDLLIISGQGNAAKLRLFHNDQDGTFTEVQDALTRTTAQWMGGGWGDYDNDGFMDLFVTETTGKNTLFHNQGNSNHWIKFQLRGMVANSSAIGAKVRIKTTIGGKTFCQMREVSGGNCCQNDLRPNFGLGDATIVELVQVEWPSGNVTQRAGVASDQIMLLAEPNNISPQRPVASLGAEVILTNQTPGTYQWRFEGTDLPNATNKTLKLTNLQNTDAGRYSVVVSSLLQTNTNFVYLAVDPNFTKITTGPIVTDSEASSGGSWGDMDNDGYLELFVANSGWTSGSERNSLYDYLGGDEFVRVTNALTTGKGVSWHGQWADYDNDGELDLFVLHPNWGRNQLFHNDGGGVFTSADNAVTATRAYYTEASWIDIDRDGWLDLFVPTQEFNNNRSQLNDFFFRNLGNGQFQALTTNEVGDVVNDQASTYGPGWCDFDNDGNVDLYVANYNGTGFLYHNDGTGRLERWTAGSLPSKSPAYSVVWGDFNNDGWFDVYITASAVGGTNSFHLNQGQGLFVDATAASGLSKLATFYAMAGDYDNDGDLDLYVTDYYGRDTLYVNQGNGTFVSVDVGSPLRDGVSDGAIWVDYNNDGFLDLFKVCGDLDRAPNLLYRNSLPATGNTNGWLKVQLHGTASNRSAIGARVWVSARIGGRYVRQVRQIMSSLCGGGNMGGLLAHFGLGNATNVDLIRIEWPSGNVQELTDVAPNQMLTITETVKITPNNPSSSLNGSVTLTRTSAEAGASYQWQFNGLDLAGQTNRTLNLTNIVADQQGRYSVVASNATTATTNSVYLRVDTQFAKITTGPLVTDLGCSGGIASADFDGNGYADLFVSRYKVGFSTLYLNQGDGTFRAITTAPSQTTMDAWYTAVADDFDNDGKPDLFLPREGKAGVFYFNNGDGTFAASQSMVVTLWNTCAVDINGDGFLDLFVSNAGPWWQNNHDRTFTRKSDAGGYNGFGGSAFADYNDDNLPEVFCASHGGMSRMFQSNGHGGFVEIHNPATGSALTAAWGDYDNDGRLDLCVVAFGGRTYVYRNLGNGQFERADIGQTIQGNFNSAAWVDYDNDGFLDLFLTCYAKSGNRLLRNNGNGTFSQVTAGSIVIDTPIGGADWSSYFGLWFDYDNDGFLDLYVVNGNDPGTAMTTNFLYHNNGNANSWLKLRLVGTTSNRDGVGAKVRMQAKYAGQVRWQRRDIAGGDIANGNNQCAHFGLGNATNVDLIRIEWPSGIVQELINVTPKQFLTVMEPPQLDATGAGQFQIRSWKGMAFAVEASPDLSGGTWTPVATVTNTGGPLLFLDPSAGSQSQRFYRVKTP